LITERPVSNVLVTTLVLICDISRELRKCGKTFELENRSNTIPVPVRSPKDRLVICGWPDWSWFGYLWRADEMLHDILYPTKDHFKTTNYWRSQLEN
jgi:hypothetical protein